MNNLTPGTEAPTIEWLKQLPEPYRTAAISQIHIMHDLYTPTVKSISRALIVFCDWNDTKEKGDFWQDVESHYSFPDKYPLPPYPEHLLSKPTQMTIDPNEQKTAREWLDYLPEPIRKEAIEACEKWPNDPQHEVKFASCITWAIKWNLAGGHWSDIDDQLKRGEILPVSPEQARPDFFVGMEIVAKVDDRDKFFAHEKYLIKDIGMHELYVESGDGGWYPYLKSDFRKYFAVAKPAQVTEGKESELIGSVAPPATPEQRMQFEIRELQNTVKELRKLVTDIAKEAWKSEAPKPIEPAPEPRPNKLPVTIGEVWSEERKFISIDSYYVDQDGGIVMNNFEGADIVTEFRSEKTAKKALAFLTLLKIAEAQNAQVERGEIGAAYCAQRDFNEIDIIEVVCPSFGQIYFHAEQGLKDCIAANEQLFRDYLEMD